MCKILLTVVLFLSLSFIASAQFHKDDVLLGGGLSYGSSKNYNAPSQTINSGNFTISFGKAVKENSVFGINLSYSPYSLKANDPNFFNDISTDSYAAGIFYRIYKPLGKEFFFFGEGGANYLGASSATKDMSGIKLSSITTNGFNIYIMPGISYSLSKKFFLEATIPNLLNLSYISQKTTSGGSTSTADLFVASASLSSGLLSNVGIGFRLVL